MARTKRTKRAKPTVATNGRDFVDPASVDSLVLAIGSIAEGDLSTRLKTTSTALEPLVEAINTALEALWPPVAQAMAALAGAQHKAVGARSAAEHATAITGRSAAAVEGSADRVRTLAARASEIGNAVRTIDEIAGRTNLVALNAAIESSRSGTIGRGFSLVAEEVRKLSERTASVARDIGASAEALLEEIDATGRTLEELQVHVQEVTAAVAQAGAGVIDLGREARVASDKLARLRGPDPGGEQAAMLRRRRDELDRELRDLLAAGPAAAGVADVLREIETLVAQVRNELTK